MPNLASFKKSSRMNSKTQIKYWSQQEFLRKNSRTNSKTHKVRESTRIPLKKLPYE